VPSALRALAVAILLAGPTALAFVSGGFFDTPRLIAALAAWALALLSVLAERPLPATRPARLALGGLAGLTALTGLSLLWAPLSERATDDLQRDLLYLGVFVASLALLRTRRTARAVEPALAAGALIVVGYGLSERLLPGVVDLSSSVTADGRLEQPLTYWNAMGALAAIGLVLCARLAGDRSRRDAARAAALAASAPLGAGVHLSYSRGALVALVVGLVAATLIVRDRTQLRASVAALGLAIGGAVACGVFPGTRALEGSLGAREAEGIVALVALLALAAAGVALAVRGARRERAGLVPTGRFFLPRVRPALAIGVAFVLVAGIAVAARNENKAGRGPAPTGARAERLGSLQSNRWDYWRVALSAAVHNPLVGVGAGGFRVEWRRERDIRDPASDAHSIYLETAAELGLAGLLALAAMIVGVVLSARRVPGPVVAGAAGALAVWAVHAGLDWDWEMPAVTLPALMLAGLVCAAGDGAWD
jgi:O-antigen ligase